MSGDQARYWAEEGGPNWVRDEAVYEAMLAPFDAVLLDALAPVAGERVLEVGCGFGATACALAATGAVVHGVDVAPAMVARARERAAEAGVDPTYAVADAETDPLGGPFDAVASRFGVMFFADPVAAFANVAAATRPGGRLAFVCWQPVEHNPWMGRPVQVVRGLLSDPPPLPPSGPGPFAFGDPAYVDDVCTRAGWHDVAAEPFTPTLRLGGGDGVAGAVEQVLSSSATRSLLDGADPAVRERAVELLTADFADLVVDGAVTVPAAVWVVTART